MRRIFACVIAFAIVSPLAALGACSTNGLVANGGACTQSIDCQEQLVCIRVNDASTGTCTDNLTGIVFVPDATVPETEGFDAVQTTDVVAPQDNFVQDTAPPPDDSSTQDTGTTDDGATE